MRCPLQCASSPPLQHSNTPLSYLLQGHDVLTAVLTELHVHALARRGDILSNEVGFDGQLAMAAIDEHRKLNALWTAEIIQRVQGCPRGPSAEQNVVHEHDGFAGHVKRDDGRLHMRRGIGSDVVSVHADIEPTDRYGLAEDVLEEIGQSRGEKNTATLYADDNQVLSRFIALGNLVRHSFEGTLEGRGAEDNDRFRHKKTNQPGPIRPSKDLFGSSFSFATSRDRVKGV
jgi:hypothetical protein